MAADLGGVSDLTGEVEGAVDDTANDTGHENLGQEQRQGSLALACLLVGLLLSLLGGGGRLGGLLGLNLLIISSVRRC